MRFASLCAVLSLCAVPVPVQADAAAKTFGKPLSGQKPLALADVLAKPEDGKAVCLEGTVAAVCASKGCWLELQQGQQSVHVTFEGYSFFVPKDSKGKAVKLEGRLKIEKPEPGKVDHLKGEGAGESAASAVSVVATGVELK